MERCKMLAAAVALCVLAAQLPLALAVPACPDPINFVDEDGFEHEIFLRGDEYYHWTETADGHVVVQEGNEYRYAILKSNGDAKALTGPAGLLRGPINSPAPQKAIYGADLIPRHLEVRQVRRSQVDEAISTKFNTKKRDVLPLTQSDRKVLVILAEFNNTQSNFEAAQFATLAFSEDDFEYVPGESHPSLRSYYRKASYNQFDILPAEESDGVANDGVIGWISVDIEHPNEGSGTSFDTNFAARQVTIAADELINFSLYDENVDGVIDESELLIVQVWAGGEASYPGSPSPKVWGHKWSYASIPTFGETLTLSGLPLFSPPGLIIHEFGHLLGLPDLYSTVSIGIGNWGVMGTAGWLGRTKSGFQPGGLCCWSKYMSGWLTPTEVIADGQFALTAALSEGASDSCLRIHPNPNGAGTFNGDEYFLIGNRQKTEQDEYLPGDGFVVMKANQALGGSNGNIGNSGFLKVIQADNEGELESAINRGDRHDPFDVDDVLSSCSTPNNLADNDGLPLWKAEFTSSTTVDIGYDCVNCECTDSVCGDGLCFLDESCVSCPQDCTCTSSQYCDLETNQCQDYCGDGLCEGDENCGNCEADCGCEFSICQNNECFEGCGDGVCTAPENCNTCQDCSCGNGYDCNCHTGVCEVNVCNVESSLKEITSLNFTYNYDGTYSEHTPGLLKDCDPTIPDGGPVQWFRLVCPLDDVYLVTLTTSPPNVDTTLVLFVQHQHEVAPEFSGVCRHLGCAFVNDDYLDSVNARVSFYTQPGSVYYFQFSLFGSEDNAPEFDVIGTGYLANQCGDNVCASDEGCECSDCFCTDYCPDDADKVVPGVCGCGVPDTDLDSDGIADCLSDKVHPNCCTPEQFQTCSPSWKFLPFEYVPLENTWTGGYYTFC